MRKAGTDARGTLALARMAAIRLLWARPLPSRWRPAAKSHLRASLVETEMAHFFFDIDDGATSYPDTEGYEMDDLAAAKRSGLRALHSSMRNNIDAEAARTVMRMTILDAGRSPIWILTLTLLSAGPARPN